MAIRKIHDLYYVYYRGMDGKICTRALKTDSEKIAELRAKAVMRAVRSARFVLSLQKITSSLGGNANVGTEPRNPTVSLSAAPNRASMPANAKHTQTSANGGMLFPMSSVIETATKRRKLSKEHISGFLKFWEWSGVNYANEVTPKMCLDYLNQHYGNGNGKSFNNNRTMLNIIFKLILVEAGLTSSPFDVILSAQVSDVKHYRPLTQDEFMLVFNDVREPWKTLSLMSWHTGLRLETCWRLAWSHIDQEARTATIVPGKTARFHRAVQIPLHDELWSWLNNLPRPSGLNQPIVSVFTCGRKSKLFQDALEKQNIHSDANGKVGFHSIRSSFITRCDEAGIDRRATRGIVGHVSDDMTDLYSHDTTTAKQILTLPGLGLKAASQEKKQPY